eukprot:TRINITY_DN7184_c0_g1_i1.p2 TRINITY_DN7184_c0_g1~~TRINITY_DN7184_c0_g1_i1.p2  ORF type:complete len:115 (+),score=38.18 TRINITY_DN7184_c0_g1_i1:49-393(+)
MLLSKILRSVDHPYITGKGGRKANNGKGSMQGLTIKSLKHHVALQPLFAIIGAGMIFVAAYIGRLASKTTDVNWTKNKDPSGPMSYYEGRQFQFISPSGTDYSKFVGVRPKYDE